jgi:hypothetical protein
MFGDIFIDVIVIANIDSSRRSSKYKCSTLLICAVEGYAGSSSGDERVTVEQIKGAISSKALCDCESDQALTLRPRVDKFCSSLSGIVWVEEGSSLSRPGYRGRSVTAVRIHQEFPTWR